MKKRKAALPIRAWALVDFKGTYLPSIHHARYSARDEQQEQAHVIDADWRVVRVEIRRVPT